MKRLKRKMFPLLHIQQMNQEKRIKKCGDWAVAMWLWPIPMETGTFYSRRQELYEKAV